MNKLFAELVALHRVHVASFYKEQGGSIQPRQEPQLDGENRGQQSHQPPVRPKDFEET